MGDSDSGRHSLSWREERRAVLQSLHRLPHGETTAVSSGAVPSHAGLLDGSPRAETRLPGDTREDQQDHQAFHTGGLLLG